MKSTIKEYVVGTILVALALSPFAAPLGIFQYQAYKSGLIQNYNQAIARNTETLTEELKFKQTLIKEIIELQEKGNNLEQITSWLKKR
jgi:hypothetical protein